MSKPSKGACCDTCGEWFAWSEFAETIEEFLCEACASGVDEDYDDEHEFDWSDEDA